MEVFNAIESLPWNPSRLYWPLPPRRLNGINEIIIHQAASQGTMAAINSYHTSEQSHISPGRGCPHICYTFVIDRDGRSYQVNNIEDVTWHCKSRNQEAIGLLVCGDFNASGHDYIGKDGDPTPDVLEELACLVEYIKDILPNEIKISCHSDYGKPNCPGNSLEAWVKEHNKKKSAFDKMKAAFKHIARRWIWGGW